MQGKLESDSKARNDLPSFPHLMLVIIRLAYSLASHSVLQQAYFD